MQQIHSRSHPPSPSPSRSGSAAASSSSCSPSSSSSSHVSVSGMSAGMPPFSHSAAAAQHHSSQISNSSRTPACHRGVGSGVLSSSRVAADTSLRPLQQQQQGTTASSSLGSHVAAIRTAQDSTHLPPPPIGGEDVSAIVVDLGSTLIRVGHAQEDCPRQVTPASALAPIVDAAAVAVAGTNGSSSVWGGAVLSQRQQSSSSNSSSVLEAADRLHIISGEEQKQQQDYCGNTLTCCCCRRFAAATPQKQKQQQRRVDSITAGQATAITGVEESMEANSPAPENGRSHRHTAAEGLYKNKADAADVAVRMTEQQQEEDRAAAVNSREMRICCCSSCQISQRTEENLLVPVDLYDYNKACRYTLRRCLSYSYPFRERQTAALDHDAAAAATNTTAAAAAARLASPPPSPSPAAAARAAGFFQYGNSEGGSRATPHTSKSLVSHHLPSFSQLLAAPGATDLLLQQPACNSHSNSNKNSSKGVWHFDRDVFKALLFRAVQGTAVPRALLLKRGARQTSSGNITPGAYSDAAADNNSSCCCTCCCAASNGPSSSDRAVIRQTPHTLSAAPALLSETEGRSQKKELHDQQQQGHLPSSSSGSMGLAMASASLDVPAAAAADTAADRNTAATDRGTATDRGGTADTDAAEREAAAPAAAGASPTPATAAADHTAATEGASSTAATAAATGRAAPADKAATAAAERAGTAGGAATAADRLAAAAANRAAIIEAYEASAWSFPEPFRSSAAGGLGVYLNEHPLLLVEPTVHDAAWRAETAELVFRELKVPAAAWAKRGAVAAFAFGRSTALVVHVGAAGTTVGPVYEGYCLQRNTRFYPVGGDYLDLQIARYIRRLRLLQQRQMEGFHTTYPSKGERQYPQKREELQRKEEEQEEHQQIVKHQESEEGKYNPRGIRSSTVSSQQQHFLPAAWRDKSIAAATGGDMNVAGDAVAASDTSSAAAVSAVVGHNSVARETKEERSQEKKEEEEEEEGFGGLVLPLFGYEAVLQPRGLEQQQEEEEEENSSRKNSPRESRFLRQLQQLQQARRSDCEERAVRSSGVGKGLLPAVGWKVRRRESLLLQQQKKEEQRQVRQQRQVREQQRKEEEQEKEEIEQQQQRSFDSTSKKRSVDCFSKGLVRAGTQEAIRILKESVCRVLLLEDEEDEEEEEEEELGGETQQQQQQQMDQVDRSGHPKKTSNSNSRDEKNVMMTGNKRNKEGEGKSSTQHPQQEADCCGGMATARDKNVCIKQKEEEKEEEKKRAATAATATAATATAAAATAATATATAEKEMLNGMVEMNDEIPNVKARGGVAVPGDAGENEVDMKREIQVLPVNEVSKEKARDRYDDNSSKRQHQEEEEEEKKKIDNASLVEQCGKTANIKSAPQREIGKSCRRNTVGRSCCCSAAAARTTRASSIPSGKGGRATPTTTCSCYELPDGTYLNTEPLQYIIGELLFRPILALQHLKLLPQAQAQGTTPEAKEGKAFLPPLAATEQQHASLTSREIHELGGFEGITKAIEACIESCDVDIRRELLSSIIVTGGTSLMPGFVQRVAAELQSSHFAYSSAPCFRLRVIAPNSSVERRFSSWLGGSLLASLGTFQQQWISREEYLQYGIDIINKRCY